MNDLTPQRCHDLLQLYQQLRELAYQLHEIPPKDQLKSLRHYLASAAHHHSHRKKLVAILLESAYLPEISEATQAALSLLWLKSATLEQPDTEPSIIHLHRLGYSDREIAYIGTHKNSQTLMETIYRLHQIHLPTPPIRLNARLSAASNSRATSNSEESLAVKITAPTLPCSSILQTLQQLNKRQPLTPQFRRQERGLSIG